MKKQLLQIASVTGIFIGAFALSAAAGFWASAPVNPPQNNVDAPVNVGNVAQVKIGGLGIGALPPAGTLFNVVGTGVMNKLIVNNFTLLDSTPGDDEGKVLKSNANGEAYWASLTGGDSSSSGSAIKYAAGSFDVGGTTCESCMITVYLPTGRFSSPPIVMTQAMWTKYSGDEDVAWWVPEVTTTYFKVKYHTPTIEGQVTGAKKVMWMAIDRTEANVSAPVAQPLPKITTSCTSVTSTCQEL